MTKMKVRLLILLLILCTIPFNSYALDTGAVFPSLGTTVLEAPYDHLTWQTPINIYTDNAAYAYIDDNLFDSGIESYILKATGFTFSGIPSDATILGVVVKLEAYYTTGASRVTLCQLLDILRAKVGTNLCSTPFNITQTTPTVITIPASGTSNLWGNALTRAWVTDADFGVALGVIPTGANSNTYIDYVTILIYYSTPSKRVMVITSIGKVNAIR